MQVRNKEPPICDHPSMNGHTQSEIYDLAQTGEIITTQPRPNPRLYFNSINDLVNALAVYQFFQVTRAVTWRGTFILIHEERRSLP